MEIKSCRNWKLSEFQEWSVIASTTNDDIVDFQKMPKMTEMTLYDLLTSNMGLFEAPTKMNSIFTGFLLPMFQRSP